MPDPKEVIKNKAMQGYDAQENIFDKYRYVANYLAYTSTTQMLHYGSKDPEIWDDDENLITDKAQLDAERRNNPDAYFTPEEQQELTVSVDSEKARNVQNTSNELIDRLGAELGPYDTPEGGKESYKLIGMMLADLHLEIGRQYQSNLASLPEDEENRELKA